MLLDGRNVPAARRMWRTWWLRIPWNKRTEMHAELCVLPRGTASDDGWLSTR